MLLWPEIPLVVENCNGSEHVSISPLLHDNVDKQLVRGDAGSIKQKMCLNLPINDQGSSPQKSWQSSVQSAPQVKTQRRILVTHRSFEVASGG